MVKMQRNLKQLKEAWEGFDFIMDLFPVIPRFPRTIATGATNRGQRTVRSRDEAMTYFEAALYEDCYMNAYLNYDAFTEFGDKPPYPKPIPNHIVIDLDRDSFTTEEDFQKALDTTLQNIREYCTGIISEHPIVISTGNGYHVHVPLPGWTRPLEDMPEFAAFKDDKDLPNKFLRWAERTLSGGSADPHHILSIKSALFRVPGTFNTKARARGRDHGVKIVQGVEYVLRDITLRRSVPYELYIERASKPTTKFFNDFLGYRIQQLIDDKVEKLQRRRRAIGMVHIGSSSSNNSNGRNESSSSLDWIERLIKTGVQDGRKNLIYWVLAPYLISIRGMDYDDAYHTIEGWLEQCEQKRSLDPSWKAFRYRMRYCLDTAEDQERKPIRFETFKEYFPDVYKQLSTMGGA